MDTNKPPLYTWRDRFFTYAIVAIGVAAIAALGSIVAAIAKAGSPPFWPSIPK